MSSILLLSLLGLLGFACQWLAVKTKLPAIVYLLVVGIVLGPVAKILVPDDLFGSLLFPYISLSVAVILFEGALTLNRHELKEIGTPVLRLCTIGMLINGIITMVATRFIVGLSWELSALFGAIMVVTGPTVIMPMLRAVRPSPRVGDSLRWEGIIIDPIGALFAVLVYELIVANQTAATVIDVAKHFGSTVLVGTFIGLTIGYGLGWLLKTHRIPEHTQNYAALAITCFTFALSDTLRHESGLLAVTLMGILLANMKGVNTRSILGFKEDLTIILVSVLFIVLAARIEFAGFVAIGFSAVGLFLVMQLVARPINVFVSFFKSDFSHQEKALVAWVGPRGIVAAAVVAIFAIRMESLGYQGAELLVPLAFSIIIGTVVVQGFTSRALAKWLGVAQPDTDGIIIFGANKFSIEFSRALDSIGINTLLCDTNWDKLRPARLHGVPTYHGNPSSKDALRKIELDNFSVFLGLSDHYEANTAQLNRFREEFGERKVYILPPHRSIGNQDKHAVDEEFAARELFGEDLDSFHLGRHLAFNGEIKVTRLSKTFDRTKWLERAPNSIALCIFSTDGELVFLSSQDDFPHNEGDQLIYLASGFQK